MIYDRFRFRHWCKKEKHYCYESERMSAVILSNTSDNIIPEQCTGLKDKNGKLIYEGDWLKTKDGYYCYVVWFEGFWWVKSLPSEAMDFEHSEFYGECEVIGNIHENADLLEKE